MKNLLLAVAAVCSLAACTSQPPTLYYWGSYETLLNQMYTKPGEADTATQISMLTSDIEKAKNIGKTVPPGLHAHLGMLYALAGNEEQSRAAFNVEKSLYPESAPLIDGMMARAEEASAAKPQTDSNTDKPEVTTEKNQPDAQGDSE